MNQESRSPLIVLSDSNLQVGLKKAAAKRESFSELNGFSTVGFEEYSW